MKKDLVMCDVTNVYRHSEINCINIYEPCDSFKNKIGKGLYLKPSSNSGFFSTKGTVDINPLNENSNVFFLDYA